MEHKRKIRVAFFADCLIENYDGAVRTMYEIINRIPSDRFEYIFVTGDGPKEKFNHPIIELPSLALPINHNYRMALSFLSHKKLSSQLDEFAPDIIHISTPSPLGGFGLNYATQNDIPVVSIYHTHFLSYIDYYLQRAPVLIPAARNILISQMQRFYNRCDLVYVPTQQMITVLSNIGVFTNHLSIWQRGLRQDVFTPSKRDIQYVRTITKNDKPNLLFASRLVWEKNLKILIEIYQSAKRKGLEYNFIIAGEGYAKAALMNSMPKGYFLGEQSHDNLSKIYASSDVFVFPSISETYGNVVMEAMASGLPCVVADGGGTRDFIKDTVNAYSCEANNPDTYLSSIEKILSNSSIRDRFILNGLKTTQSLNWEKLVDRYFDEISRMIDFNKLKAA